MTIYTGDMLVKILDDGNFDIEFKNGQPDMTNGFETLSLFYTFGEDCYINDIVRTEAEKMQSRFPEVIRRNVVSDKTKNDGTQALKRALKPMLTENMARKIDVTGEIINAYTIYWESIIRSITDETIKYFLNWEHGELTAGFSSIPR